MDTGRVIHKRYLLQRLIKRGNTCTVYQAFDQVLQRPVVVKIAPAEYIAAYRAAIRTTSQFSHPNIIGIYDLIIEPECLYIVQEYVEGDDYATLLQSQLAPYYVADIGMQICQALLYASTPSRKTCHGDLTPAAMIRDRRGQVRINNFALPSDLYYFTAWSVVGGNGIAINDRELPAGLLSDGRRDDDVRAVGLLLYQLLAGRNADATSVEPPPDGRLRFLRNVPPELCDVIAKAVVRQHPQHINTAETLYAELKTVTEKIEPAVPVAVASQPLQAEDVGVFQQYSPVNSGRLGPLSAGVGTTAEAELARPRDTNARMTSAAAMEHAGVVSMAEMSSMKLATAFPPVYVPVAPARRINLPFLILIGIILFLLFFGLGYFISHILIF